MSKPLTIVTGASSGIGLELAAICAEQGSAIANVTPDRVLAEQHRKMAEPDSGEEPND